MVFGSKMFWVLYVKFPAQFFYDDAELDPFWVHEEKLARAAPVISVEVSLRKVRFFMVWLCSKIGKVPEDGD